MTLANLVCVVQVEQLLAQQEKALLEAETSLLAPVRLSPEEFGEGCANVLLL